MTVRTVDLGPGSFLVLDEIVRVDLAPPAMQVQAYERYHYSVDAVTTSGARVHLRSFAIDPSDPTCVSTPAPPCGATYEVPAVRAEAEEFMAEIRYCIEHP